MKVIGLGNDLVEVERIKKALLSNASFESRIYTSKEIELINKRKTNYEGFAGRFAAKEAVAKALGTGVRGFNFTDIEILQDELGKPLVNLRGSLEPKNNIYIIEITISHTKEMALATALIVKKSRGDKYGRILQRVRQLFRGSK